MPKSLFGTLHEAGHGMYEQYCDPAYTRTPLAKLGGAGWSKRFHVWRMDWAAEAIRLSVDDRLLNETKLKDAVNPDGTCPFKQPHYLLLNQAIGGTSGGDPSKLTYPVRFEVDWVRVYDR